eukprot:contig_2672_g530
MILMEGFSDFVQVDAENYNQEHPEHAFQQLMAYTQSTYRQAKALKAPMESTSKPLSPTVPNDPQEKLKRQRLVFAKTVNWGDRQAPTMSNKAQVHAVRVAMLQSITEALTKEAPTDIDLATETSKRSSGSGNE